jgi:hypothetical protein
VKADYFGKCLVGGRHPISSREAKECPVRFKGEKGIYKSKCNINREVAMGAHETIKTPKMPEIAPNISDTSDTINIASGRAGRSGRPKMYADRKAAVRAAVQAYRAREKTI